MVTQMLVTMVTDRRGQFIVVTHILVTMVTERLPWLQTGYHGYTMGDMDTGIHLNLNLGVKHKL